MRSQRASTLTGVCGSSILCMSIDEALLYVQGAERVYMCGCEFINVGRPCVEVFKSVDEPCAPICEEVMQASVLLAAPMRREPSSTVGCLPAVALD